MLLCSLLTGFIILNENKSSFSSRKRNVLSMILLCFQVKKELGVSEAAVPQI